jgi:PAS domain S-box-containing protein
VLFLRYEMKNANETKTQLVEKAEALYRCTTERKKSNEYKTGFKNVLRKSRINYRSTLDGMLEGCQVVSYDWRYLYLNDAAASHSRHLREELLGHTMMEMYPGIENTEMFAVLRRCMEKRTTHQMENEFTFPDGSKAWFDLSMEPVPEGVLILSWDITERKKLEEQTRQLQQYLKLQIDRMPLGLITWDTQFRARVWNHAARKIFGFTAEEALGKRPYDLIVSKEAQPHVDTIWRRPLERDMTAYSTNENTTKDGHTILCEWTNTPLKQDDGTVVGVLSMVQDITERNRTEKELELQARLLDSTADSIFVYDFDGHFVYVNENAYKSRGYSKDELMALNCRDLNSPEYAKSFDLKMTELQEKEQITFESVHVRKDGPTMPVEVYARAIESGGRKLVLDVTRDITKRKSLEEELRVASLYTRSLIEASLDPLVTINPEGKITDVNETTVEVTGISREELIGTDFSDYFTEPAKARHGYQIVFEKGIVVDYPLTIRHTSGELTDVLYNASVYKDEAGNVLGVFAAARDVTERKRAEKALKKTLADLERSNAELERFAYVASHDLQEPLRMVSSYAQLLEKRYKDKLDADAHDFIGYAVDGAKRMQNLINDLLTYSRVGTRSKPFEPTDCEEVFAAAIANLDVAIKENKAKVTHDPLPTVMADEGQLVQVFQNLISNGIKFHGKKPPHVHISAQAHHNDWVFSVKDNGIGIDPQYFDRIFIIFQRLHGEGYPGTGIGLAVAKKIVNRHDGRMWIESQHGKGSTFYFTIPAKGERQEA